MSKVKFLLSRLDTWYGPRAVRIFAVFVLVLVVIGSAIRIGRETETLEATEDPRVVTVSSLQELASGVSDVSLIGSVRAVSEVRLQSESAGRVTEVYRSLGEHVRAGTILASIENSRERAAVLQAEGVYEAAKAQAAQSDVGKIESEENIRNAHETAKNTYRSAFAAADTAIRSTADQLFSNTESEIFGLRLTGKGNAPRIVAERKMIGEILSIWRTRANGSLSDEQVGALLEEAEMNIKRIWNFIDELAFLVSVEDPNDLFTTEALAAHRSRLIAARTDLGNTEQSLINAQTTMEDAKNRASRAVIASTGSDVSLADAQVKQALGALRSAQSAYEKTLIRTPISGVVNALYLRKGEYVGQSTPAAVVANNNALEITTYIHDRDRELISVGDTVNINGSSSGRIVQIAPAIDPLTKKIEVRISGEASDRLKNGDTVRITFSQKEPPSSAAVLIPLTAVKFKGTDAYILRIGTDGTLTSRKVELGEIRSDRVEVKTDLTLDTEIVTDVRGFNEGEPVITLQ